MIQQINLYQDIVKQGRKAPINWYWVGIPALFLLFIALTLYLALKVRDTEQQVQQLRKKLISEQTRIDLITAKIPKQEVDPQLAAEVTQWKNMLDELKQNYQSLSDKEATQSSGFSGHFQALANQAVPEVWLRGLFIDGQQRIINIEGSSFKPEKIPYFLQQLQKEPIFNGHSFAQLQMQQSETLPNQIDFKLSTTLEITETKDHAK